MDMKTAECLCDECGKDFLPEQVRECLRNGDDRPCKVCPECCKSCGYHYDDECGF